MLMTLSGMQTNAFIEWLQNINLSPSPQGHYECYGNVPSPLMDSDEADSNMQAGSADWVLENEPNDGPNEPPFSGFPSAGEGQDYASPLSQPQETPYTSC